MFTLGSLGILLPMVPYMMPRATRSDPGQMQKCFLSHMTVRDNLEKDEVVDTAQLNAREVAASSVVLQIENIAVSMDLALFGTAFIGGGQEWRKVTDVRP